MFSTIPVFAAGFLLQMNLLIGGSGAGASSTGGYGYRATDFLGVICVLLLLTRVHTTQRIVALYIYVASVLVIFGWQIMSDDSRMTIFALHYVLYCLAGLFICIVVDDEPAPLCFGLLAGLVCSIFVFMLQASNVPESTLAAWGIAPGYRPNLTEIARELPRYAGLWGHPNEVGHVVAMGMPAASYLFATQRRLLPMLVAGTCLLLAFYFCWSRGGLIAGGITLLLGALWPRNGKFDARFMITLFVIAILAIGSSQLDFFSSRFGSDPNLQGNTADRLASIYEGLKLVFINPLGLSVEQYFSDLNSATGGVGSPHNGFLFLGATLGVLPLVILIYAIAKSIVPKTTGDMFFLFLSIQFCISSVFEQVSGSYSYVFIIGILIARAYLKTSLGRPLLVKQRGLMPSAYPR